MEHDFVSRPSGKFPGAAEHLERLSYISPDGMFQTEIPLPFLQAIFDTEFQTFAAVLIFGMEQFCTSGISAILGRIYHGTGRDGIQ